MLSDNGFHSKYLTIFFPIFTYYLHALYFFDYNILYIMLQKKSHTIILLMFVTITATNGLLGYLRT